MMPLPLLSEVVCQLSKTYSIPNFSFLCHHFPVFPVCGNQVKILREPNEFYDELLSQCARAHKRITLASLYIGNGQLETNLVSTINNNLLAKPELKVNWLLDYTRASRNVNNSRTLLLPLIRQNPTTCKVNLYHTPALRGLLKFLMPERWNETVGLQHMKIYIFDSSIIVSGANLSNDYFVNRQDRYVVIENCEPLADFYEELVQIISSYSLQLDPNDKVAMRADVNVHPFKGDYNSYCGQVNKSFQSFWDSHVDKSKSRLINLAPSFQGKVNTFIFPTFQMSHFGINLDGEVTHKFLLNATINSRFHLASGYFNLTDQYIETILKESKATYSILCAHPQANGFLGAGGFAGGIPAAYTNLCKMFYEKVIKLRLRKRISVSEYKRDGWTFHSKGLWYFLPDDILPIATMIGSPNFGYRSVYRDLETQLLITTSCPKLRIRMNEEQESFFKSSLPVSERTFESPDRKVPFWVKLFTYFMKKFF